MCRMMLPLIRTSLILAQIAFGAALASRAQAGLIPVRVEQSPFEIDVLLEWTEEGTEEPLVVLGLDDPGDWQVQVNVSDLTGSSGEWSIRASVFHRSDPHEGSRAGASGGIGTVFDNQLFGQVLDLDRIVFHAVVVPNEVGDPSPPLPHLDRLQLDVFRNPIADAASPNTIRIRGTHVTDIPEPGSISLLLIALVLVGLVYRRFRGRVILRR